MKKKLLLIMIGLFSASQVGAEALDIREKQQWTLISGNGSSVKWLPGAMFVSTSEQHEASEQHGTSEQYRAPGQHQSPETYQDESILTVHFELNHDTVMGEEFERLSALAGTLKGKEIIVEGHACWLGSDEYNLNLSERRSHFVASILGGHGVTVVLVRGWGEGKVINHDSPAVNRRVEIYQTIPKER